MHRFYMGADLGQANDPTALAVVELVQPPRPEVEPGKKEPPAPPATFSLRHLERVPLRTPYPGVVSRIRALLAQLPLAGCTELVVDHTGVGRPVVDLLEQAGLRPVAVSITGGDVATSEGNCHRVPKRDLVVAVQVLLQDKRLRVAEGLLEWPTLERELLAFKVKIDPTTAHDSYSAREGAHDDLVLALALACWRAKAMAGANVQWLGITQPRRW